MSIEDVLEEIRKDVTNYLYELSDLNGWRDGLDMPKPQEVAVSLLRLVEAGFATVEPLEKE
jgi:hypothetical protein